VAKARGDAGLSDPIEIDTGDGLLRFDGRVLERFGYGRGESQRIHIAEVKGVELTRKRLVGTLLEVKGRGSSGMMIPIDLDEEQVPELEGFLDKVRAGAPNLERG